jgi:hypothetical protein
MREKDTYSDLNKFDARDQRIIILNVFRQDFLTKGYTAQLSFHANFDEASRHFDQNDFITRPAPIGAVRDHYLQSYYLGWTGDGHIGRLNITHAFYEALGEDGFNGIAQRARFDQRANGRARAVDRQGLAALQALGFTPAAMAIRATQTRPVSTRFSTNRFSSADRSAFSCTRDSTSAARQ